MVSGHASEGEALHSTFYTADPALNFYTRKVQQALENNDMSTNPCCVFLATYNLSQSRAAELMLKYPQNSLERWCGIRNASGKKQRGGTVVSFNAAQGRRFWVRVPAGPDPH